MKQTTAEFTPVLLLTGYLGSGKTTLLNRILSNKKGIKFAVIVNDLGDINIDAELIEKGGIVDRQEDSLVALQNGCICCTLKMDLVEQLHGICSMRKFDYIVIEASGICEPAPIAQTICSIPSLGSEFTDCPIPVLDCIVTVVDALRMQSEFNCGDALPIGSFDDDDIEKLIIEQIEFCNIVILNKISEVSKDDAGRITQIIRHLQPKADIFESNFCDIDLGRIIDTKMFDFDKVATSAAWIDAIEGDHEDEEEGHHHHHHHCHNEEEGEAEEYGISTFTYYRREALDINKFDNFVAKHWPKNIIRAKGLCYFRDDTDKCWLFEQAGLQKNIKDAGLWYATMPKEQLMEMMIREPKLAKDWDPVYGDRMTKIVFIGRDLDKEKLKEEMDKLISS